MRAIPVPSITARAGGQTEPRPASNGHPPPPYGHAAANACRKQVKSATLRTGGVVLWSQLA